MSNQPANNPIDPNRYIDFDAMMAEKAAEPVVIRLFQEDWNMPANLPAETVILIMKVKESVGLDNMGVEDVIKIGDSLIPLDIKRVWFDKGMDVNLFASVVGRLINLYTAQMNYSPAMGKLTGVGETNRPKKGKPKK